MVEIIDCEQRSPEWYQARKGYLGASSFGKALAGGTGATRRALLYYIAAERLTDDPVETYSNAAMEWGIQTEPQARSAYELVEGVEVNETGFIRYNDWIGCSPDGLIGDDGLIEIKCPNTTTQIETYLSGQMPSTHIPQVQGQLFVTGRQWCDFLSFDPRIKNTKADYFKIRIERDDSYINNILWPGLEKFVSDLKELLEKLK